jgi:hypothetical protein
LEESYEDDLVESIFEEVSEETWEAIEEAILNELSPGVLKRYLDKSGGMPEPNGKPHPGSVPTLRAQGKAHRVLGNDKEADRLRDKAKKRDSYFAKAIARHNAGTGFKKKGQAPAVKGSPVDKASKKMPQSYYKE